MRIEHIAMYVNDLEAARDFFVKYFNAIANEGYHNKTTDFRSFFLSFQNGSRLEIMTRPKMEDEEKTLARTGYVHIAFPDIKVNIPVNRKITKRWIYCY